MTLFKTRNAAAGAVPSTPVRPLRFPVLPHADETLPGLLARATREHSLGRTRVVLDRIPRPLLHPGSICVEPEVILRRFADALQCPHDEVLRLAHTYCSERQHGGPVRFGDAVVLREDILTETRRIAPLTLAHGEPYQKAWWTLVFLPYCPESLERVVDTCSACADQSRLGWRIAEGIGVCETCGEPVPPSDESPLPGHLADGYRLFADLLAMDRARSAAALATLPAEVQALDPRTLLETILQVGATCRDEPVLLKRNALRRLPAILMAEIVSTGATMIGSWPTSIQAWARTQAASKRDDRGALAALRGTLRRLGLPHSARPEQIAFVREALPDLFLNVARSFADAGSIVLGNEAARITGLDLAEVRALADAGILQSVALPGVSCPLLSGPSTITVWTKEGTTNACEEAQARGDYREAT